MVEERRPLTLAEVEDAILRLKADMGMIQAQLSEPDRKNPDTGERLSDREYHVWKSKAVFALQSKAAQCRELKRLKSKLSGGFFTCPDEIRDTILGAYRLFHVLSSEGRVVYDAEEQAIVDRFGIFVRTGGELNGRSDL